MRFVMIQEDIDQGRGCEVTQCPVARCLKRCLPADKCKDIYAGLYEVGYYDAADNSFLSKKADTPPHVRKFMTDFDLQLPVQPIEFELDLEGF